MKNVETNKFKNKTKRKRLFLLFSGMAKNKIIVFSSIAIAVIVFVIALILIPKNNEIAENDVVEDNLCTIQFNTNGGSTIEKIDQDCGLTIKQPEDPVKNGFDFLGWYYNDQKFDFSKVIDDDVVLQAKWEAKDGIEIVVVSFDSNGGSKQENIEIEKGSFLNAPVDPVRDGYIFTGWYLDNNKFGFNSFIVTKDITLVAKWAKDNNKDLNTTGDSQDQEGSSDSDKDENKIESEDSLYEYDDTVKKYSGRWYLNGYEDIFLDVKRNQYFDGTAMEIVATNFATLQTSTSTIGVSQSFSIYPCTSKSDRTYGCSYNNAITILYSDWDNNLKEQQVSLGSNSINIGGYKFVRNKGTKNMLTGKMYTKALGTWYLDNHPDSVIKILSDSDTVNTLTGVPWYWIETSNFDLNTFKMNAQFSTDHDVANSDELFNKYGISISGNVLTINNGKEIRKFYKTKNVIDVTSITLNHSSVELYPYRTAGLKATVYPTNAYDKKVLWTSSNNSIVSVSEDGSITAKSPGTATITASTSDGSIKAHCTIIVKEFITGVSLNNSSLSLDAGDSYKLVATVKTEFDDLLGVTWSSSNENIATVDKNGNVFAKAGGVATITVTTNTEGKTAQCVVTVIDKIPELKANASVGISYACTDSGCGNYTFVSINASGGSGSYSYSYDVYKDGSYIGTYTSKDVYLPFATGNYVVEYRVTDSTGNSVTGSTNTTISQ